MNQPYCRIFAVLICLLVVACSTTTLSGSWKSPDFQGRLHKVYLIGVAKNETVRRIFEDGFDQQLQLHGVTGLSSYKDLPSVADADQSAVTARVQANGADSVLMARLVSKRVEQVTSPGRIEGYSQASPAYYNNWGSYYDRRFEASYSPPTVTQFEIATIEANIYEVKTGKLIWSAQLETVIGSDIDKLVTDFAKTVTEDLQSKELL